MVHISSPAIALVLNESCENESSKMDESSELDESSEDESLMSYEEFWNCVQGMNIKEIRSHPDFKRLQDETFRRNPELELQYMHLLAAEQWEAEHKRLMNEKRVEWCDKLVATHEKSVVRANEHLVCAKEELACAKAKLAQIDEAPIWF